MKLHITHQGHTRIITVDPQPLMGLRINDRIRPADLGVELGPWWLVIKGASGKDGTPIRADYHGVVPKRLWSGGHKRRFRPNRIDKDIVVLDCVMRAA